MEGTLPQDAPAKDRQALPCILSPRVPHGFPPETCFDASLSALVVPRSPVDGPTATAVPSPAAPLGSSCGTRIADILYSWETKERSHGPLANREIEPRDSRR